MADNETTDQETQVEDEIQATGSRMLSKGTIAIVFTFIALVIAVECAMAYFWMPSADQIAEAARKKMGAVRKEVESVDSAGAEDQAVPVIEVDLGKMSVSRLDPKSNVNLRIDFHPIVTVWAEDEGQFAPLYQGKEGRLEDKISAEVRKASYPDLTDPDLGLIKRRIKETSNALLGKPIIQDVFFKKFSVIQH